MEALFQKIREYIKMTEDLPFAEFAAYYQEVMDLLQKDYQDLSREDLLKAVGICQTMHASASSRAAAKDANKKKFAKMAEKSGFWQGAIKARLIKEGMTAGEIEDAVIVLLHKTTPDGEE